MSSGSIRIIQLPEKSSVNTDDYMAVDSSANGTKKVKFTDLLDDNLSAQNKAADAQATGEAISGLNTDINTEKLARQSTDNNLQAQIDQLVAPSGTAPNPAEIENARIGADGVTYDTLGNAIRTQFTDVKSALNYAKIETENGTLFLGYETVNTNYWIQGDRPSATPYTPNTDVNRATAAFPIHVHKGDKLIITIPNGKRVGLLTSYGFVSGWFNNSPYQYAVTQECDIFFVMANTDTTTPLTPEDAEAAGMTIQFIDGSSRIKMLENWQRQASPLLLTADAINTAGYTVNNGRIYSASNDTKRSGFIPVSAGSKIAYRLSGISAFNLISFYTDRSATSSSAPSYVSGVAGQAAGTYTEGVFTAPSDGYIVATNMTAYTDIYLGGVDGFYGIDKRLDALEDASGVIDLTGKYILNFGDSLGHGYGNSNKSYAYMLAQETGATLADYAVNGTPYANYGLTDSYACVCNQVKSAISDHSSHDVAIILVEGGINDLKRNVLDIGTLTDNYDGTYAQNMIIGATEDMFYRLKNAFPSAKIVFVMYHKMPLSTTNPSLSYTDMYARQETEHAGLKSACEKWSVPMADVYAEGSLNSNIQSMAETYFGVDAGEKFGRDIAHPNALGYRKFYIPLIKAQLLKLTYE